MKHLLLLIEKFITKVRRDGLLVATKKGVIKVNHCCLSKVNPYIITKTYFKQQQLSDQIDKILDSSDYDRILLWRGSFGWSIPLFQRPQHLATNFSDQKCLVFYETTKMTDKYSYIKKLKTNLYLVDFESSLFLKILNQKLTAIDKPKYVFISSTSWDIKYKMVQQYVKDGFYVLYDYLDDLNPSLVSFKQIPDNIKLLHQFVMTTPDKCFVTCTADALYNDAKNKRGSDQNIFFVCNGVDYDHFTKLEKQVTLDKSMTAIIKSKTPIVGYYGALADWFDYQLIRQLAQQRPQYNIVLIGMKYDTSYDQNNLDDLKNVHYLGVKNFQELPYYAKHFSVSILPFLINDITKATSPVKIFEYMALGKPIVSTDLPECRKYKSVQIASTHEQFISMIDDSLTNNDLSYLNLLKQEALNNTWFDKTSGIIKELIKFERDSNDF